MGTGRRLPTHRAPSTSEDLQDGAPPHTELPAPQRTSRTEAPPTQSSQHLRGPPGRRPPPHRAPSTSEDLQDGAPPPHRAPSTSEDLQDGGPPHTELPEPQRTSRTEAPPHTELPAPQRTSRTEPPPHTELPAPQRTSRTEAPPTQSSQHLRRPPGSAGSRRLQTTGFTCAETAVPANTLAACLGVEPRVGCVAETR
ncbi:unnamed protein product [Arctogadus glacialis]